MRAGPGGKYRWFKSSWVDSDHTCNQICVMGMMMMICVSNNTQVGLKDRAVERQGLGGTARFTCMSHGYLLIRWMDGRELVMFGWFEIGTVASRHYCGAQILYVLKGHGSRR
jgi:hypothetical protein